MPLYLPRELHDWFLRKRLDEGKSMYDVFKKILADYAIENGFTHKHRWKLKSFNIKYEGKLKTYDTWETKNICIVCGEIDE